MSDALKLPRYSLKAVALLREELAEALTVDYYACALEGPTFHDMVWTLLKVQKLSSVPFRTLLDSLGSLAGVTLYEKQIAEVSWRVAGNLHLLRKGVVVPPWSLQREPEWAPLEVEEAEPGGVMVAADKVKFRRGQLVDKVEKHGGWMTFRVLAGTPAGKTVKKFWSLAYAGAVKTFFGFTRFNRDVPRPGSNPSFWDIRQLTRLRLYGLFEPKECSDGPNFVQLQVPSSCLEYNQQILRARQREGFSCPKSYPLEQVPCHRCEVGYDSCQVGTHPRTFVRGPCGECHAETWFDQDVCLSCKQKR